MKVLFWGIGLAFRDRVSWVDAGGAGGAGGVPTLSKPNHFAKKSLVVSSLSGNSSLFMSW